MVSRAGARVSPRGMRDITMVAVALLCAPGCAFYFDGDAISERADASVAADATPDAPPALTGCAAPISCPPPDGNKVTICGSIHDLATGDRVELAGAAGDACDGAGDGPCALRVRAYDPLAFAADPVGTTELAADFVTVDDCGRFRMYNVTRPFNGFLGIAVDAVDDSHVKTFSARPVDPGDRAQGLKAYVATRAVDDAWTASAGDPFGGATFAEKGTVVGVYRHGTKRVAGVTMTVGGVTRPSDDFYFDDSGSTLATIDASRTSTGPTGAGLLVNSGLTEHSGTGAEPSGCEWYSTLAASTPGVFHVVDFQAHELGDEARPCP